MLWTYLDLQDKSHLLALKSILSLDRPQFPSPNTPVCTGPSARSLDANGMPRLTIVLMRGAFCSDILWDLLYSDMDTLTDRMTDYSHVIVPKAQKRTL
jgi:hypothetical protein